MADVKNQQQDSQKDPIRQGKLDEGMQKLRKQVYELSGAFGRMQVSMQQMQTNLGKVSELSGRLVFLLAMMGKLPYGLMSSGFRRFLFAGGAGWGMGGGGFRPGGGGFRGGSGGGGGGGGRGDSDPDRYKPKSNQQRMREEYEKLTLKGLAYHAHRGRLPLEKIPEHLAGLMKEYDAGRPLDREGLGKRYEGKEPESPVPAAPERTKPTRVPSFKLATGELLPRQGLELDLEADEVKTRDGEPIEPSHKLYGEHAFIKGLRSQPIKLQEGEGGFHVEQGPAYEYKRPDEETWGKMSHEERLAHERKGLEGYFAHLAAHPSEPVIGYNVGEGHQELGNPEGTFDLPYLRARAAVHGLDPSVLEGRASGDIAPVVRRLDLPSDGKSLEATARYITNTPTYEQVHEEAADLADQRAAVYLPIHQAVREAGSDPARVKDKLQEYRQEGVASPPSMKGKPGYHTGRSFELADTPRIEPTPEEEAARIREAQAVEAVERGPDTVPTMATKGHTPTQEELQKQALEADAERAGEVELLYDDMASTRGRMRGLMRGFGQEGIPVDVEDIREAAAELASVLRRAGEELERRGLATSTSRGRIETSASMAEQMSEGKQLTGTSEDIKAKLAGATHTLRQAQKLLTEGHRGPGAPEPPEKPLLPEGQPPRTPPPPSSPQSGSGNRPGFGTLEGLGVLGGMAMGGLIGGATAGPLGGAVGMAAGAAVVPAVLATVKVAQAAAGAAGSLVRSLRGGGAAEPDEDAQGLIGTRAAATEEAFSLEKELQAEEEEASKRARKTDLAPPMDAIPVLGRKTDLAPASSPPLPIPPAPPLPLLPATKRGPGVPVLAPGLTVPASFFDGVAPEGVGRSPTSMPTAGIYEPMGRKLAEGFGHHLGRAGKAGKNLFNWFEKSARRRGAAALGMDEEEYGKLSWGQKASARLGRMGQFATGALIAGGAVAGNTLAAGAPDAFATVKGSLSLAAGRFGQVLIGPAMELSLKLQDAANWIRGWNDSTKEAVGQWVKWGLVAATSMVIFTKLVGIVTGFLGAIGTLVGGLVTATKALYKFAAQAWASGGAIGKGVMGIMGAAGIIGLVYGLFQLLKPKSKEEKEEEYRQREEAHGKKLEEARAFAKDEDLLKTHAPLIEQAKKGAAGYRGSPAADFIAKQARQDADELSRKESWAKHLREADKAGYDFNQQTWKDLASSLKDPELKKKAAAVAENYDDPRWMAEQSGSTKRLQLSATESLELQTRDEKTGMEERLRVAELVRAQTSGTRAPPRDPGTFSRKEFDRQERRRELLFSISSQTKATPQYSAVEEIYKKIQLTALGEDPLSMALKKLQLESQLLTMKQLAKLIQEGNDQEKRYLEAQIKATEKIVTGAKP
ncbi:MAG TPA: hypothetical protein VEI97_09135 [bacterium]|nr:hypothetical protein [bacterium]